MKNIVTQKYYSKQQHFFWLRNWRTISSWWSIL